MRIDVIQHTDRLQVNLPAITCLLSSEGQLVVDKLLEITEQIVENDSFQRYVCLVLQGEANDRNIGWYDDLNKRLLLAETFNRIMKFRWLLSLIRKSRVPWIFLSADDCLGSTWELALACHRRYWFSEAARLGFPDVSIGGFPCGGSAEAFAKTNSKFREFWQKNPVITAASAFQNGYVSFCSVMSDDWQSDYPNLLDMKAFAEVQITTTPQTRKYSRSDISETFGIEAREVVAEQLDAMRVRVRNSGAPTASIWDYCWGLIKQRSKFKDSRELGRLIVLLSARFYHSNHYQFFIYANCVKAQAERLPRVEKRSVVRLVIDLNFFAPPTSVLVSMLESDVHIIFVSTEGKTLMSALNMIYNRLERAVGAEKIREFWRLQVAWYCGYADTKKCPILRWTADDRIMIVTTEGTFEYLRLEGNSVQAGLGIMEAVNNLSLNCREFEQLGTIVPMIATGVYENPFKTSKLPLSIFIRSSLFQEAMRIARYNGQDVLNVIQSLKTQGWTFAGDDEAWDRFLSSRMDIYNFDRNYQNLGFAGLTHTDWGIGNLKHARTVTKKTSEKVEEKWSPTQSSQHLAIYLGLLVLYLCRTASRQDIDIVDHIASVAVGFPVGMGTPVGHISARGSRRVNYYGEKHWSDVKLTDVLNEIKRNHDVFQ